MKELSIEEKAKRYDELMKKLNEARNDDRKGYTFVSVIDNICPELSEESEGERIREALIEHFKWNVQQILNDFDNKEVLAWLEKQGEIIKELSEMKFNNIQTELQDMVDLKLKAEQGEQKSAWSEEDENRFKNLIYLVEHSDEDKATKEGFIKFINRLKYFKKNYDYGRN